MNNISFVKKTICKFFNWTYFTKEEIYTEKEYESDCIKFYINQDYFKQEFDLKKKNNEK